MHAGQKNSDFTFVLVVDTRLVIIIIIIIIIIIQAFVRRTMSASELNLRRRQSLGGEDG